MSLRVLTPPEYEPVTLDQAKLWCRVDDDDSAQDATLLLLIQAMRDYAENLTGRAFAPRSYELRLDAFPARIHLPYPPLRSIDYLRYVDGGGSLQSLDTSPAAYDCDPYAEPACVAPLYGQPWPYTYPQAGAVRLGFTAGYASRNDMPPGLRLWMQARIATLYENREQLVQANLVEIPRHFCDGLLDSLRLASRIAWVG